MTRFVFTFAGSLQHHAMNVKPWGTCLPAWLHKISHGFQRNDPLKIIQMGSIWAANELRPWQHLRVNLASQCRLAGSGKGCAMPRWHRMTPAQLPKKNGYTLAVAQLSAVSTQGQGGSCTKGNRTDRTDEWRRRVNIHEEVDKYEKLMELRPARPVSKTQSSLCLVGKPQTFLHCKLACGWPNAPCWKQCHLPTSNARWVFTWQMYTFFSLCIYLFIFSFIYLCNYFRYKLQTIYL